MRSKHEHSTGEWLSRLDKIWRFLPHDLSASQLNGARLCWRVASTCRLLASPTSSRRSLVLCPKLVIVLSSRHHFEDGKIQYRVYSYWAMWMTRLVRLSVRDDNYNQLTVYGKLTQMDWDGKLTSCSDEYRKSCLTFVLHSYTQTGYENVCRLHKS